MDEELRIGFNAKITAEAREGWRTWLTRQGVNWPALAEVMGRAFAAGTLTLDLDEALVLAARELAAQRAARGGTRG